MSAITKRKSTRPSTSKQQREVAKQIEPFMSDLPSAFLYKYAKTQPLIVEWRRAQNKARFYGLCLKARFGGGGGNPLFRAWKNKEICDFEYKFIDADLTWLSALFTTIQSGWDYIEVELQKSFIDYPDNELSMFFEILREEFDNDFQDKVKGFKLPLKSLEADAKSVQEICSGDRPDLTENEWRAFKKEKYKSGETLSQSGWLTPVLNICWQHTEKDEVLKNKLEELDRIYGQIANMVVVAIRQERSPNPPKILHSTKWEDGILHEGVKGGYRTVTKFNQSISQSVDKA